MSEDYQKKGRLRFGFLERAAETHGVDLMPGDFAGAKKHDGHVVSVEFAQLRIFVDIHFAQRRGELAEDGKNRSARFIAEAAFRTRVKRRVARLGDGEASLFTAPVNVSAARGIQIARANQQFDGADDVVAARGIASAGDFHQGVQVERFPAQFVKHRENAPRKFVHKRNSNYGLIV